MWLTKVQTTAVLVLSVALIGGGSAFTYRSLAAGPGDQPSRVAKLQEAPAEGNAKHRSEDVDRERLKQKLEKALANAKTLQVQVRLQQDLVEKYRDQNAQLARRVKISEARLVGAQSSANTGLAATSGPVPGVLAGETAPASRTAAALLASTGNHTETRSGAVEPSVVQDARDAVDIMKAQLDAKKGELAAARVDMQAAQRKFARFSNLAKGGTPSVARRFSPRKMRFAGPRRPRWSKRPSCTNRKYDSGKRRAGWIGSREHRKEARETALPPATDRQARHGGKPLCPTLISSKYASYATSSIGCDKKSIAWRRRPRTRLGRDATSEVCKVQGPSRKSKVQGWSCAAFQANVDDD